MKAQFECIDEQTHINEMSLKVCCTKVSKNYENAEKQLNVLLDKCIGAVSLTLGGKILINTINNKTMATAIVRKLRCCLVDPGNNPNNLNALEIAQEWLNSINQNQYTNKEYVDCVIEKFKSEHINIVSDEMGGDEADSGYSDYIIAKGSQNKEILMSLEQWGSEKRRHTNAQRANNQYYAAAVTQNDKKVFEFNESQNNDISAVFINYDIEEYDKKTLNEFKVMVENADFSTMRKWSNQKGKNEVSNRLCKIIYCLHRKFNKKDWYDTAAVSIMKEKNYIRSHAAKYKEA
ncbi:MAG: hypothetical protein II670_11765 [Alphaproteobacteria bacterium]|nr:hypothetical protein [Alphaproteobacteria bacterium]